MRRRKARDLIAVDLRTRDDLWLLVHERPRVKKVTDVLNAQVVRADDGFGIAAKATAASDEPGESPEPLNGQEGDSES